jgi:hypothetical protein
VKKAAEFAANCDGHDVYVGLGLSKADLGPARRCTSEEIAGIAGIGGDFDLKSAAHGNKPLPATIEDALSILPSMQPSILIGTGNGVHAWWLLKEPAIFESEEERREVARLFTRWHTMLQLRAAGRGWAYDRLSDLARVLRIPGTLNHKDPANPKEVTVLSANDRRYNLSDLEEFLDAAGIPDPEAEEKARREWAERFADKPLVINPNARIPQEMIDGWMRADPRFRNTWERRRHDLKDPSNSGYDLALACFGVDAGLSEQQMVDLIIHHRAHHGQKQRTRVDYFQRTIAKASQKAGGMDAPLLSMAGEHACADTTGPVGPAVPPTAAGPVAPHGAPVAPEGQSPAGSTIPPAADPEVAKALLCQRISQVLGVNVLRLVKFEGKDPTYHMQLEQGKIEFATVDKLINYGPVRSAIAAKVGHIIPKIKPKEWEQISQMLLQACFVEECTEEEDFEGSARAHLLDYLAETDFIPSIEGQRVQDQRRPMIADGRITVSSSDFLAYLNKTKALNLTVKAAASMLGAIGAKKTDKFRNTRLNRQSRWALPSSEFDPAEIKPNSVEGEAK